MSDSSFGFDLRCQLGVATAATQIEGGYADTNWHRFAAEPGRIADGTTPARAADHWNRVESDLELLKELGVKHYRMGLEWARIEPEPGRFDLDVIAHYVHEIRLLRAAGINPLVTLHHFNNPGWFEEKGAFVKRSSVAILLRYFQKVLVALRELVTDWVTINEPNVYAVQGYIDASWPPGRCAPGQMLAVMQNLAEAHIRGYEMIHALIPEAQVGVAQHLRIFRPSRIWNPIDRIFTWTMQYFFQKALVRAMSLGRFQPPFRRPSGIKPGRYYDFQGINYYTPAQVRLLHIDAAHGAPVNDLGWEIYPQGLVELASDINRHYPGPIWITENGTADARDGFRPLFIYDHLQQVAKSDLPIERFYHWCFTDNWEWADGEAPRFGLLALDYETQERTWRDSARFYADIIANSGVTPAAYQKWVAGRSYPINS